MRNNKISHGMEMQNASFEAAKRKIFLVAMPCGMMVTLAIWSVNQFQHTLTTLDGIIMPVLAGMFLTLFILLLFRLLPARVFEMVVYILVLAYGSFAFTSIMMAFTFDNSTFNPNFTLWLPFVYMLGFLIMKSSRALLISIIFFGITVIIGATCMALGIAKNQPSSGFSILIQAYLTSAFYIVIFYLVLQRNVR